MHTCHLLSLINHDNPRLMCFHMQLGSNIILSGLGKYSFGKKNTHMMCGSFSSHF